MSAPTGNRYAEKWTLERTLDTLRQIESYSYSNDCYYLGHALSVAHCYDDIWAYWQRKWKKHYEVIDMMKRILQRFEVRLFDKMAKKEIPERVGMFALKHHYGWGREPVDTTYDDYTYVDHELIPEPKPVQEAKPQADNTQTPEQKEEKEVPAKPMTGQEFMQLKKKQYNQQNPTAQILTPAAYFDGDPPPGLPAILFEDGYFLKC